jgi:hypothetical protein
VKKVPQFFGVCKQILRKLSVRAGRAKHSE